MRLSVIPVLLALATPIPAQASAPIVGNWVTHDRSAVVRLAMCGRQLCGTIERVLDPAAPAKDINNPDPARRRDPLVGSLILTGFTSGSDGEWSGGIAYDPKVGRSYRSKLKLESDNRLEVSGCILFICKSFTWTRAS